MDLNPGSYTIKEKIADGGMAEVFKAVKKGTLGFEKTVVLKKLLPVYSDESDFISMLTAEAKVSSDLSHPNIVQTIDFVEVSGDFYMVLEYIDGKDLGRIIKKSRSEGIKIERDISLFIISEILKGLVYAHNFSKNEQSLHIIHRDISPQNILISYSGHTKLTDFGIASSAHSKVKTKTGEIKGKANYMSPEQIKHSKLDHRSDLFSVACVLYELIYGKRPFERTTEFETLKAVAEGNQEPDFDEDNVDGKLLKIIKKGLQRDVNKRYSSAHLFLEDILAMIPEKLHKSHEKLKILMDNLFKKEDRSYQKIEKTPVLNFSSSATDETFGKSLLFTGSRKFVKQINFPLIFAFILIALAGIFAGERIYNSLEGINTGTIAPMKNIRIPSAYKAKFKTEPTPEKRAKKTIKTIKSGSVSINSHPWSTVYINGKEIGETPVSGLKLNPGKYILNLAFSTGENLIRKFTVKTGEKTVIFEKSPKK